MYKKAHAGEIKQFKGIDAQYKEPEIVYTSENNFEECTKIIIDYLIEREIFIQNYKNRSIMTRDELGNS